VAIQNIGGYRPGGTATAIALNSPTVIQVGPGTLWSVNCASLGGIGGNFYDAATIAAAGPTNWLFGVTFVGGSNAGLPIPFTYGLVYISDANTTVTVGYAP